MNNLTRLRLINHRANRLMRPERIREAIVKITGEKIAIERTNLIRGGFINLKTHQLYYGSHLILIDNPEEGD